ncbi:hypothetical protein ACMT1E_10810 [Sphingomonas flavalba]|uniref:NAD(P)H-dependent amine dehydrogenase family protein n=1 Tax=Sphingomonas flavalba TaxID=2559804 RepID=UPI0039E1F9B8
MATSGQDLKVYVCGTGTVGGHAARGVLSRKGLKLIGAKVYSEEKRGRDVGELLGVDPLGVAAVLDIEEVIAAAPDCVIYAPSSPNHDDLTKLLSAGINVISTAGGYLFYPVADAPLHNLLEGACQTGGATFHGAGVNPGFVSVRLPLVLSSWCRRIDRIRVSECAVMTEYPSSALLFDLMHFGQPLDPGNCEKGHIGQRIRRAFEAMLLELAAGIGARVDEIIQTYEEAPAPRDLHVAAGVVKKGTVAAQRWLWTGMVDGKPLIELETVWTLSYELEGWPNSFGWTFTVDGDPGLSATLHTHGGENSDDECCIATAMQAVNAVEAVVAAAPGIRTYLDLPSIHGRYHG